MAEIIHKHMMVDTKCKNPQPDPAFWEKWMTELVSKIGMKIAIPPRAAYVDDVGNEGPTCVCAITTSHISAHHWTQTDEPYIRFDLYSCKEFDVEDVISHFDVFQPYDFKWHLIYRN